jgi:nucleotide-binding universal stress UspA family protein
MAYTRLLVPLDGSNLAERAIPYAKTIGSRKGNEIVLFTVTPVSNEKLDHPMKAYLDTNARVLKSQGITATTAVAHGNPAEEIIRYIDRHHIDLTVISTHGNSGVRRWILGSVAQKVLYGTSAPVLLVKSGSQKQSRVEFKKVLVSLDGSPFSEASIPHVEELLQGSGSEVILLRVGEIPKLPADRSPSIKPNWEEYRDMLMADTKRQIEEYLKKIADMLAREGIRAKQQATIGKADEIILQLARKEDADLIIMTTQGRTGISRWVYGSVASRVVEGSSQPLLLIRPAVPK